MNLLQPRHGGNLAWAAAQAGCSASEILDFSASINPLGPPKSVLQAIQRRLGEIRAYPEPGATSLRSALGELHHVPPDWVLVGSGAAELLTWACRSLSELDCTYVLAPGFRDYGRALDAFGAKTCPHILTDDLAATLALLQGRLADGTGRSAGLLLNNPHNPTGQIFTKAALLPLVARAQRVVLDEAFMEFLPNPEDYSLISEVAHYPNLVILRSLTKFYSIPGLRLGYAVGHPDLLGRWQAWRDPWSVNTLAIAAGVAALQDDVFQEQTHQWLAQAKPQLLSGLMQVPGLKPIPGAANFLLVQCNQSVTQLQLTLLQQYQILIRDCISFPELGDRFFRVAVRTEAENDRLLQALSQIMGS